MPKFKINEIVQVRNLFGEFKITSYKIDCKVKDARVTYNLKSTGESVELQDVMERNLVRIDNVV